MGIKTRLKYEKMNSLKYEVGIKTRLKYEVGIKSRLRNKMGIKQTISLYKVVNKKVECGRHM